MNGRMNMVIYDQWPYMTMFAILEVVLITFREGMRIDRRMNSVAVTLSSSGILMCPTPPKNPAQ